MAGERVPIPAYGGGRRPRGPPPWARRVVGTVAYVLVLWLVALPAYPLPTTAKAALGFTLAGLAAGRLGGRPGWLAGLLGFGVVLALALLTLAITLGATPLGLAFLVNGSTAGGDVEAVGRVRRQLLLNLAGLAGGGCLLSMAGGMLGAGRRAKSVGRRPLGRFPS